MLKQMQNILGDDDVEGRAETCTMLADILSQRMQLGESQGFLRKALDLRSNIHDSDHPSVVKTRQFLDIVTNKAKQKAKPKTMSSFMGNSTSESSEASLGDEKHASCLPGEKVVAFYGGIVEI